MFKKGILFLFFLIIILFKGNAQSTEKINSTEGLYVDQNGLMINGDIDFTYQPKNPTYCSFILANEYTPGYYYDLKNNKISGKLKYSQYHTHFKFSLKKDAAITKIKADECLGYVIGNDSFAVIKDFYVERDLASFENEGPEFAEVITTIGDLTFYLHTRLASNKIIYTYLVRKGENGGLESFPKNGSKYKTTALKYFQDIPYLKNKIENEYYTTENFLAIIKYFEFYNKYKKQEKIFYTNSWDETKDINKSKYYAIIEDVKKSKWSLKFYLLNDTPLYSGVFYSISPIVKHGTFLFYYPDGTLRKKVKFKADKIIDTIQEFHKNGTLHYEYFYKKEFKQYFTSVKNINGIEFLDRSGNGVEIIFDESRQIELTRNFKSHRLISSFYRNEKGSKIYQTAKNSGQFKSIISIDLNLVLTYPDSSIIKYNHGLVLVKILVDQEGNTKSIDLIKGLDKHCNDRVIRYCNSYYNGRVWAITKIDKLPIEQEIIIPFIFELEGYSRYRNGYNNNLIWHQQMMHQQMMYNQNRINQIKPPPIYSPRF